jgi:D-glycero-D-manno-heptose 1,7-bisphosphate phosphatase
MPDGSPAVFLDRDGVLVEDAGLLTEASQIRVLPGAVEGLSLLRRAGFRLVVVSNQAVVARGLLTEAEVVSLHGEVEAALGTPPLDGFYFCPHHPKATLPTYRMACACRKPSPGMLLQAASDLGLDLAASFMVGDRPTDLIAGERAGCRTIWVQTGQHDAPLIETGEVLDPPRPDFICENLAAAARWILGTISVQTSRS